MGSTVFRNAALRPDLRASSPAFRFVHLRHPWFRCRWSSAPSSAARAEHLATPAGRLHTRIRAHAVVLRSFHSESPGEIGRGSAARLSIAPPLVMVRREISYARADL